MSTAASPAFRLNGWHVLAGLVAFFGVVIAVDVVMMVDAYSTFSGEVSTSPYEDGLAYDSQLDQQRDQARLGWRMTLAFAQPGEIRLSAVGPNGAPLSALRVTGRLERPATEAGRLALDFREASPGVYVAQAGRVAGGAWDARISAYDRQGRRFDAERRLLSP
jgi:nitrogen fixation protein FixH